MRLSDMASSQSVRAQTNRGDLVALLRRAHASRGRWLGPFVLVCMVAVYIWWFSSTMIDTHRGLGTSSYDIGLYDQGIWLMSRFKAPFVTLMGRNLMGDHASLILVFLVPLYWILPGCETLLTVQSIVIACGAIPIFLYARKRLQSDTMALVMCGAWLLHPAVGLTNLENFHPDAFLGLFVPLALYAALERKWRLYAVAVVLSLLVKEDVLLVILPLGVWVALRRDVKRGIITIVATLAATFAGMFLLMKSLIGVPTRNGWRIPYDGPVGFVKKTLTDPTEVFRYLSSEGRLFYLWQMVAPVGAIFFIQPEIALISILVLAGNIVSTFWYQFHIGYHYSLVAVPALVFGTVFAIGRVRREARIALTGMVAVSAVVCAVLWGPFDFSRHPQYHWPANHPVAVDARELMDEIPSDAVISVLHSLAPHVAHRRFVYQFPNPFRVVLYGTDVSREGSILPEASSIEFVMLPKNLDGELAADWRAVARDFEVHDQNASFILYRRKN